MRRVLLAIAVLIGSVCAASAQNFYCQYNCSFPPNGGQTQVSLNFPTGGFEFINALKGSVGWTFVSNNAKPVPTTLDSNGYPIPGTITNGGLKLLFTIPTQAELPGNWCLDWTGAGTTNVFPFSAAVSGSSTSSPWCVTPSSGSMAAEITATTTGNPLQNLRFYYIGSCTSPTLNSGCGYYDAIQSGEQFNPQLVKILKDAKIGTIRFLDWQVASSGATNLARYAEEKPASYVFYEGDAYPADHWLGTTTNGTGGSSPGPNDYAITCPVGSYCNGGGAPADKDYVEVQFNAAMTTQAISGVTIASQAVVTVADATQFSIGQNVVIAGVVGVSGTSNTTINTSANAFGPGIGSAVFYTVQSVNTGANTVTLNANTQSCGSGSTNCTAYVSGGIIGILPTFSLNGAGAKPIFNLFAQFPASTYPATLAYAMLRWDATLQAWLINGGSTNNNGGLTSRVPPSVIMQLAAEVGADAWLQTPVLSIDSNQHWVTNASTSATRTLTPFGLKYKQELPDEIWNLLFPQTIYGIHKSIAEFGTANSNDWTGKALSTICQDVAGVFGHANANITYECIGSAQTTNPSLSNLQAIYNSTQYVSQQGGSPAYNWSTHFAITTYYFMIDPTGDEYSSLVTDVLNFATGTSTAQTAAISDAASNQYPPVINTRIKGNTDAWATDIATLAVPPILTFYEGGNYNTYSTSFVITASVSALSTASSAVLTLGNDAGSHAFSGVVNQNVTLSGFAGACGTAVNGNTYQITAASPGSITINLNSSALTCATGTLTYGGLTATIASVSNTNPCVLTLSGTNPFGNLGSTVQPQLVSDAMPLAITGITGPALTSATINAVGASTVTVNGSCVGSSFTSGTASISFGTLLDGLYAAASMSSVVETYDAANNANGAAVGAVAPAYYPLSGITSPSSTGPLFYPDIYSTPSKVWNNIATTNGGTYP